MNWWTFFCHATWKHYLQDEAEEEDEEEEEEEVKLPVKGKKVSNRKLVKMKIKEKKKQKMSDKVLPVCISFITFPPLFTKFVLLVFSVWFYFK